jgi:Protein of unknown function with HXXEE motif
VPRPIHGRWPKVAAIAAPLSTAALFATRDRLDAAQRWRWAAMPLLLWHQVEEWVWPGGFIEWLNREVLGSSQDLAPLTRERAFVVNVRYGWGMSLAASTVGDRVPAVAIFVCSANAANATMHLGWAVRHRRWDPGAVTAAFLLFPWSAAGLRARLGPDGAPAVHQLVGLAAGAGAFTRLVTSMGRSAGRHERPAEASAAAQASAKTAG